MNKFKLVLWVIILAIIALVIFQNLGFFATEANLQINPLVAPVYETPGIPIAVICIAFFILGLFLAFIFGVPERFRNRKTIKKLTADNATQKDEIEKLKKEVAYQTSLSSGSAGEGTQLTATAGKSDGSADDSKRPADAPEK